MLWRLIKEKEKENKNSKVLQFPEDLCEDEGAARAPRKRSCGLRREIPSHLAVTTWTANNYFSHAAGEEVHVSAWWHARSLSLVAAFATRQQSRPSNS